MLKEQLPVFEINQLIERSKKSYMNLDRNIKLLKDTKEGKIPVLQCSRLKNFKTDEFSKHFKTIEGEFILMCRKTSNISNIQYFKGYGINGNNFALINKREDILKLEFLSILMEQFILKYNIEGKKGNVIDSMNLFKQKIKLPSLEYQNEFLKVFHLFDETIEKIKGKQELISDIKQQELKEFFELNKHKFKYVKLSEISTINPYLKLIDEKANFFTYLNDNEVSLSKYTSIKDIKIDAESLAIYLSLDKKEMEHLHKSCTIFKMNKKWRDYYKNKEVPLLDKATINKIKTFCIIKQDNNLIEILQTLKEHYVYEKLIWLIEE